MTNRCRSLTLTAIALLALSALGCGAPPKADAPPQRSAGWHVLNRFVGVWDMRVTSKLAGQEPVTVDAVSFRRWSKKGEVVLFEDPAELDEMHFLLTDDPESRSYPGVLLAGRFRAFYTGTWNDETRTMTWNGTYAEGSNFVGVHRFIDPDHAEASGTIRDLAGRVINEVSWKQQRRREN